MRLHSVDAGNSRIIVSISSKTYETAKQSRNPRLSLAAKAVTLVVAFNTTMLVVAAASHRLVQVHKVLVLWPDI